MSAIRKSFIQFLFSGSYMRRWNDKLRPVELYEIDKQAHKMIVAWMLTLLNSRSMCAAKRFELQQQVIERGLFDYLYRLVVTDIKPPVFYKIRENKKHYAELTTWVLAELKPIVEPLDGAFWQRLIAYHQHFDRASLADRILETAHLYASGWEFAIIKPFNSTDEESNFIEKSFADSLAGITDVQGVDELLRGADTALGRFAAMCGRLRFQIRWSDTPRIPETSVLGHMFFVGALAYSFSMVVGACRARCVNNFFSGLFHDLPELLTRDIISPVKRSIDQLPELIRQYELFEMENRVLGPLLVAGHTDFDLRLRYFLGLLGEEVDSEFNETVWINGKVQRLHSFDELQAQGNDDALDPKDGDLLKTCDNLAAFLEAYNSVQKGVSSTGLYDGMTRIRATFHHKTLGTVSLGTLLADFD